MENVSLKWRDPLGLQLKLEALASDQLHLKPYSFICKL